MTVVFRGFPLLSHFSSSGKQNWQTFFHEKKHFGLINVLSTYKICDPLLRVQIQEKGCPLYVTGQENLESSQSR